MPSYTAKELERETGFDRRTIAYYVQEGLLPKVGRRGPRTRYPKLVRDRLLFIRRVREAEEAGDVSAVSLSDMRKVFERVPRALIAGVADRRIAVTPELVAEPSTAFRPPAMRRAALEGRLRLRESAQVFGMSAPASRPAPQQESEEERLVFSRLPESPADLPVEGMRHETVADDVPRPRDGHAEAMAPDHRGYEEEVDVAESLLDLVGVARLRNEDSPRSMDTWTRIEVSPEIVLSVRGITEEDEGLVERVRRAMLRLIAGRGW